jgi:hypothetical protein
MVVLSVGVGVVADQVSGFVLGVSPFG